MRAQCGPPLSPPLGLSKSSFVEDSFGPVQILGELALQPSQTLKPTKRPDPIPPIPNLRVPTSASLEDSIEGYPSQQGGGVPQSSHSPGFKLVVDLNKADCRRRRRRKLSNLIQIHEENSSESGEEEAVSKSPSDSVESSQHIIDEVRATMAIGAELNVNFLPNDERVLKKMIILESKEAAILRQKEGGI